jgi:hypothetical protein
VDGKFDISNEFNLGENCSIDQMGIEQKEFEALDMENAFCPQFETTKISG